MKSGNVATAVAAAAALLCAIAWFHEQQLLREASQTLISDTLDPVVEMLKENAALTQELRSPPYAEGDNDFVSAYLIRSDRSALFSSPRAPTSASWWVSSANRRARFADGPLK